MGIAVVLSTRAIETWETWGHPQ